MKGAAAVLFAPNRPLTIVDVDIQAPRADELLVRVESAGICHTDLGVIAAAGDDQLPIVLGHEGSGVVQQVGAEVSEFNEGDRVILSYNYCGKCDNCIRDLTMHCREFVSRNMTGSRIDGSSPLSMGGKTVLGSWFGQSSWATHAITNVRNCVKVSADLPVELLGPLGCGFQTGAGAVLNTLAPPERTSIAIFGVGSVGLAALLAARVAGCTPIIAIDIDASRLTKAAELGATHTVNSQHTPPVDEIRRITSGEGAQYSVDCIGLPTVVRAALECLQTPGVCATLGFQGVPNEVSIDQGTVLFGKSLVGVIEGDAVPQRFIPQLLALYAEGRFPFDQLVDVFDFSDINDAISAARDGSVTKAVLTFDRATSAHV